ncbi:MAG: hypothetical protein IPJ94_19540 [Chloroflexi bacterium]|nr:hypothetical protein [Chloroflexota bacterium]
MIREISIGERLEAANYLAQLEKLGFLEQLKFLDFKEGLKLRKIKNEPNESAFALYWSDFAIKTKPQLLNNACQDRVFCESYGDCSCTVAPPLGDQLLKNVVEGFLRIKTNQKIAENVCSRLRKDWEQIGAVVSAWSCGSRPIRA